MNSDKRFLKLVPAVFCIALLIFDGNAAIEGAREGLNICFQTVIPSLFPFLFLSSLLSGSLSTPHSKCNHAICRLYHIPRGTEGILLSGLLGGYPVGAKCVAEATEQSRLSSNEAERMIVFCNATGPAFLFGITGSIFTQKWVPWCLWGIHLLSGLYTARLSSTTYHNTTVVADPKPKSLPQQLRQSIRAMSEICGWIILMRTGMSVAFQLCLWRFPKPLIIFLSGMLEISNGCISLMQIEKTGLRFVLCAIFLNFGGLCVALQTQSVSTGISHRKYLPGKCIQAMCGLILAYIVQAFAFSKEEQIHLPYVFYFAVAIIGIHFIYSRTKSKKSCGIF